MRRAIFVLSLASTSVVAACESPCNPSGLRGANATSAGHGCTQECEMFEDFMTEAGCESEFQALLTCEGVRAWCANSSACPVEQSSLETCIRVYCEPHYRDVDSGCRYYVAF